MNNADMPAMPLSGDAYEDIGGSKYAPGRYEAGMGLTKREYFAALAMQGLLAAWGQHDVTDAREIVGDAVTFADALLAELDKEAT